VEYDDHRETLAEAAAESRDGQLVHGHQGLPAIRVVGACWAAFQVEVDDLETPAVGWLVAAFPVLDDHLR